MTPDRSHHVISVLWPHGDNLDTPQVYALLDGARDRRIEPLVRLSRREYHCLYSGVLSPRLEAAAPYIVHLSRDGPFTRELLRLGWGNSWGFFAIVPPDTGTLSLRRHFRRFLRVRDESGRRLFFRFYDPRVLRVYLPTCTGAETTRFFGPAQRFVLEATTPEQLMIFTPSEGGAILRLQQA